MKLSQLLSGCASCAPLHFRERDVTTLTCDSRAARPGALFAALRGTATDGRAYIRDAIDRGATVVLSSRAERLPAGITLLVSANPRKTFAQLAANFHAHPTRAMTVVGVTGTNGKTTCTSLLQAVFRAAGHATGRLGTIDYDTGRRVVPASHTTPDPMTLHACFAEMRAHDVTHAAIEVSSHALAQHRTDGIGFAGALFTNLTQDHLDYHGTLAAYARAKARLFRQVRPGGIAIVNGDDRAAGLMTGAAWCAVATFGCTPGVNYLVTDIDADPAGSRFVMRFGNRRQDISTPLVGRYNVANAAGVFALAHRIGIAPDVIARGLADATGAPGRLERVATGLPVQVFVDYAHTPDALENVLSTLKAIRASSLCVVFGCGGDRDRGKRALMGAIAARLADRVVVTSDNPRTENAARIIDDIFAGIAPDARARVLREPDRATAIDVALRSAVRDEIVVIAGKGHEDYQIIGTTKHPFDDRHVAAKTLAGMRSGERHRLEWSSLLAATRRAAA